MPVPATGRRVLLRAAVVSAVCAVPVLAGGQNAPAWPDTLVTRVQALALIETLNADLLASRSATATLERWCREHRLASEPRIVADVVTGVEKSATAEQRQRLQVGGQQAIRHRHVQLRCGTRVLSKADNWYVPGRLTREMNDVLDSTTTPFGRVVQPLEPYRRTLAVTPLWSPLPRGWALELPAPAGAGALAVPEALFAHRAILYTRDHLPFSEVDEIYQRDLLAFPLPLR